MILPEPNASEAECSASRHVIANPPHVNPTDSSIALFLFKIVVSLVVLVAWASSAQAAMIAIPNSSFEMPATSFVDTHIDSWQQTPGSDWGATGVFLNTPPTSTNHIENCDGNQAAYLFANPGVSLAQDYDSADWANPTPTHAFNSKFNVNRAYRLTVGIIGGVYGDPPLYLGATLQLSLYYRDAASNMVIVAATTITNSAQLFPTNTHLVDFSVQVPGVLATDPWANQNIGVQIASTVTTNLAGGYWDLDNARLTETLLPALTDPQMTNNQFGFTLQSQPGLSFEILATTNLSVALSNWTSLGTLTNVTGAAPFLDPATNLNRRFFQARQLQ
jgi:hypothetical protein